MSPLYWILNVLCALAVVWGTYMAYRNERVYRYKTRLLNEVGDFITAELKRHDRWNLERIRLGEAPTDFPPWLKLYELMPDYGQMMRRFWVWPLSRFGTLEEMKRRVCP